MKFTLSILLLLLTLIDPTKIGKTNEAKSDAMKAYNGKRYKEAIMKYRYLVDSLDVEEDEVKLNLANAYYLAKDTANARPVYESLSQSSKNTIRSNALQQLGVMNNSRGKAEEALSQFKQAIKADPGNTDARYNYEMLKKKLDEKKKQDQQNQDKNKDDKKDQNKDQQKKDDQNKQDQNKDQKKDQQKKDQKEQDKKDEKKKDQEQKDQEKKDQEKKDQQDKKDAQDKKDEKKGEPEKDKDQKNEQQKKDDQKIPKEVADKLMNIMPQEKAKMILEAMKNQEVQYLQQNKRKATKPKDKGKPDW